MSKKLTILDIAKLAGVGKSMVSRVLTSTAYIVTTIFGGTLLIAQSQIIGNLSLVIVLGNLMKARVNTIYTFLQKSKRT
jgi:hypothetical protein